MRKYVAGNTLALLVRALAQRDRSGREKSSLLLLPVCVIDSGANRSALVAVFTSDPSTQNNTGRLQHKGGMESRGRDEVKGPVLHIVVVGFHHKKGCQVREPLLHANTG